jgi:hypothetical protein
VREDPVMEIIYSIGSFFAGGARMPDRRADSTAIGVELRHADEAQRQESVRVAQVEPVRPTAISTRR